MSLRWRFETYRKLYVREEGSFAQLPAYTRALGALLLKHVDGHGFIPLQGREPWQVVAFIVRANRSDRRLIRRDVDLLMADGYLRIIGDRLHMRNFVPAQEGHDQVANEPPPIHDEDTTGTRPGHDPVMNEQPPCNEKPPTSENQGAENSPIIPSFLPSLPPEDTSLEQAPEGLDPVELELAGDDAPALPRRQKREPAPEAVDLAERLAKSIAYRDPGSQAAREQDECISRWADPIDKLHRIDGRSWDEIEEVAAWSQRHPFWQTNILSGGKLREKFDALVAQMHRGRGTAAAGGENLSSDDLAALRREAEMAESA